MNVLVFNCGSSSLKYKLLKMPEGKLLAGGEAQRVGPPSAKPSSIIHKSGGKEEIIEVPMADHGQAFEEVMKVLARHAGLQVDVVGHRLVHGGTYFKRHAIVDVKALAQLQETRELAPLHNPPAINLVEACQQRYPALPQVCIFDTAYHSTIPAYAQTYALPAKLREDMGIRKYGFHGTSHEYVAKEAAKYLGIPLNKLNAVSCHLGSGGASLCAIVNGISMDNTMGYSPLQGLIMSTRCGDLDPAVTMRLLAEHNGKFDQVEALLNKKSGVLGLSGVTADIRDVFAAESGAARMDQTREIYLWRLRKYLGSYLAIVGEPQAVIFTDTIGETSPLARWAICADMEAFGLVLDAERNANVNEYPMDIAAKESSVRALVILTNEELAIAGYTYEVMQAKGVAA